jgi:hypothetical protein
MCACCKIGDAPCYKMKLSINSYADLWNIDDWDIKMKYKNSNKKKQQEIPASNCCTSSPLLRNWMILLTTCVGDCSISCIGGYSTHNIFRSILNPVESLLCGILDIYNTNTIYHNEIAICKYLNLLQSKYQISWRIIHYLLYKYLDSVVLNSHKS